MSLLTAGDTVAASSYSPGSRDPDRWMPSQIYLPDPCLREGQVRAECVEKDKYGLTT